MFKNRLLKPEFWDISKPSIFSLILLPLTIITIFINYIKKLKVKKKFNIKTICVGNIYLGGTGKTPLVIKINEILKKKYKTYVIKKNYKEQIDEQDLLRNKTNLIVSNNRTEGLKKLKNSKKIVAIFDDGLQDKSISYNLSIVCFNTLTGVGNGKLLPAGPLREDLSELKNYDAVFLNGKKDLKIKNIIKKHNNKIKVFSGYYYLKNKKNFTRNTEYLAFCGIGNPNNFFNLLKKNKINIKKKIIFPDHYNYNSNDINKIKELAIENKLKIITTEKDFIKLKKFKYFNTKITNIDFKLNEERSFKKFLESYL